MKQFYVDTCIWLNLFKKEGDATKGKPYWKIAEEFTEEVKLTPDSKIVVSTIVLKELTFKLGSEYHIAETFFKKAGEGIMLIKSISEDYDDARKVETRHAFRIGFLDCLHIIIAKRIGAVLVTRDKELLLVAKEYGEANKPENLVG